MSADTSTPAEPGGLRSFLDASPLPCFAVAAATERLVAAGFTETRYDDPVPAAPGRHFIRRDGTLIAWQVGPAAPADVPLRLAAAHTDSPGFRIKQHAVSTSAGWVRLAVEVYGGPLTNSWLDRDLGLAGRVLVGHGDGLEIREVIDRNPVLRMPQLAIHLDRAVNDTGVKLDRQQQIQLLWAPEDAPGSFADHVAHLAGVETAAVRSWELAPFDLAPAAHCGARGELLASARLDDLVSCHAAVEAITTAEPTDDVVAAVALVDHEEVGSTSTTGADAQTLPHVLEQIAVARGADRREFLSALTRSHAVSLDMAHATHPNYPERHDPAHPIRLNGGPVVKHNAQQRYATSLTSTAPFLAACDEAGVDVQHFVSHSEMPCGSTIGPALSSVLGVPVVDVGVAQLAMHSVREVCGSADPERLVRVLTRYLSHS